MKDYLKVVEKLIDGGKFEVNFYDDINTVCYTYRWGCNDGAIFIYIRSNGVVAIHKMVWDIRYKEWDYTIKVLR